MLKDNGNSKPKKQTVIRCKYCNAKLILEDLKEEEYCEKTYDGCLVITCPKCEGQFIER